MTRRVLNIITSATGAARHLRKLVEPAVATGWDVWIVGTPQSAPFLDTAALERITGHAIEFHYRKPDEPKKRPPADALIAAGVSFNTVNKWALGIADNLAASLLCELPSYDIPVVCLPFINEAMAKHPALARSYEILSTMGARILADQDNNPPHPPNQSTNYLADYPWIKALELCDTPRLETH